MKIFAKFVIVLLWGYLHAAGTAFAGLNVPYVGLNKTHLEYDVTASSEHDIRVELRKNGAVMRSETGTPPIVFKGTLSDEGLGQGNYSYEVVIISKEENKPEVEIVAASQAVSLDGVTVSGTLLFDESISAEGKEITVGGLTVPEGTSLSLEEVQLKGSSLSVYGEISLSDSVSGPLPISLHSVHSFSNLQNVYIAFGAGSDGSRISDSRNVRVSAGAPNIYIYDCTDLTFIINPGAVYVLVQGGSVTGWGMNSPGEELQAEFVDVDLKAQEAWGSSVSWSENSRMTFYSSRIDPDSLVGGSIGEGSFSQLLPPHVVFEDCLFRRSVTVQGGKPEFRGCEFSKAVLLENRTGARFEGNTFRETVFLLHNASELVPKWYEDDPLTPIFEDNSFLGNFALSYDWFNGDPPPAPIEIGTNYYGEKTGPKILPSPPDQPTRFLSSHGSGVWVHPATGDYQDKTIFTFPGGHNKTGEHRKDTKVFPFFWTNGWIVGQNVLEHQSMVIPKLVQGKETLLSIDIGVSDREVRGARVIVEFAGEEVPENKERGDTILRRDLSDYGSTVSIFAGFTTFDFILPPTDLSEATLKVWLDTCNVTGYEDLLNEKGTTPILETTLKFDPLPQDRLRIVVQPIWIISYGSPGASRAFTEDLRGIFPALLPLGRSNLLFWTASKALPYTPGAALTEGLNLYPLAAEIATTRKMLSLFDWIGGGNSTPHFVVALLPKGALGHGVDGANVKLFRGTLFVTEDKPIATIHELGHAGPNIYLSPEQYKDPRWDATNGMPLRGVTAFQNDNGASKIFNNNGAGRLFHLPDSYYSWYSDRGWVDVMGEREPSWIAPSTLSSFRSWILSTLYTQYAQQSAVQTMRVLSGPPEPGKQRIFISADTQLDPAIHRHKLVKGTVRAMNVSPLVQGSLPSGDYAHYSVIAYDADGNPVFTDSFEIHDDDQYGSPPESETYSWAATFDVPDSAVRLEIRDDLFDKDVFFDLSVSGSLSTQILSPSSGAVLKDRQTITWKAENTAAVSQESSSLSQPLQHLLFLSTDGGKTWEPLGLPVEGESAEISAQALPAGNNISIRLITSDGLRTVEDRVDGLRVLNHPPVLTLQSPLDGDAAEPGFAWTLAASAFDPDEELQDKGTWRSSLDGVLGSGPRLENIVLSPGDHILSYSVTDSQGAIAEVSVRVSVTAVNTIDLALNPEALSVIVPGKDGYAQEWSPLVLNEPHVAALRIRNAGVDSHCMLKLYLKPPNGAETLLAQTDLLLPPFTEGSLRASFTPTAQGEYRLRGVVEAVDPSDGNTANNQRTWLFSTAGDGVLTVTQTGEGKGTVASEPVGIDCGTKCSGGFDRGIYVTLKASPAAGSVFSGWSGDCAGEDETCTVIMDYRTSVAAAFSLGSRTGSLRVTISPQAVLAAGAQWRVDGGAWRNSGATVSGLSVGEHTVEFKSVRGWTKPANQTVSIEEDRTTTTGGTYIEQIQQTVQLPLKRGWNLISLPLAPLDPRVESVLSSLAGSYRIVWSYQEGAWLMYDPTNEMFSNLDLLDSGYGYWIDMLDEDRLEFEGTLTSPVIDLTEGWNLAGYCATVSTPVDAAFASIENYLDAVWSYRDAAWWMYDPAAPEPGTLQSLDPGWGYWIKVNAVCSWTLP